MSDCCDFQPEFKIECITEIIRLLRSGDMDRDKTLEVAKHAACFIGCGAALMQGNNEPAGPFGALEAADKLEALVPQNDTLAKGPAQAVPWLSIIQILLPILLDLLKEEK
jgi:hypothetical protein